MSWLSNKWACRSTVVLASAALAMGLAACGGGQNGGGASGAKNLVVDSSFDLKTADPNREYETTGSIVAKAVYETLLTFQGEDVSKPIDGLASYTMSDDNKVMTLTIKPGHKFSSGNEVTVDDAVFSLQRVQGIKGNPSFLLDGVEVAKTGADTMTLTCAEACPALPYIIPNPALGIVDKKLVEENGGSTDAKDSAEAFLNKTSAGSGPYMLESFDAATQVVFTKNPQYAGPAPAYDRVVLRNVQGPTQKLNVESGDSQVALDLNPDQIAELANADVKVTSDPSRYTIFLLLNQDPAISPVTSNPDFLKAVKQGINYQTIVERAGKGSVRPGGIIPTLINGSIPEAQGNQTDVEAAKASLKASGYKGEEVTLNYPNDMPVQGLQFEVIAQAVQAQLKEVGINIKLAPAPVATELDAYRDGKEVIGLWYWGPDFPDPSNYLVFTPGEMVGLRAGWKEGADPAVTQAAQAAQAATDDAMRAGAYGALQDAQNATGPFIPLVQPAQNVAMAKSIQEVPTNPVWTVTLAEIK